MRFNQRLSQAAIRIKNLFFNYFNNVLSDTPVDKFYTKMQHRKYRMLRLGLLLFLSNSLLNVVYYSMLHQFYVAFVFIVFSGVILWLLFNKRFSMERKVVIVLYITLVLILLVSVLLVQDDKLIELIGLLLILSAVYFKPKEFRNYLITSTSLYYFIFFYFGHYANSNILAFLPYLILSLLLREFVKDAEKNERIIDQHLLELNEVDKLKSRLFANISHEIRTPLTLIMSASERSLPTEHTAVIQTNTVRLVELVDQILELSKVESGGRRIVLSTINLSVYLDDNMVGFRNLAAQKGISFNYQINMTNDEVVVDKDALTKIFYNLIANAIKFSESGDTISLNIHRPDEDVLNIIITDTGIGIEADKLPHIFNQFYHSEVGQQPSFGIGLALVKELVNTLGGHITVDSKLHEGSTFTVALPCSLAEFNKLNITFTKEKESFDAPEPFRFVTYENLLTEAFQTDVAINSSKELLLLIEDNEQIRNYITQIVSPHYTVVVAPDGESGLAKAFEYIPDIIISDIMMPRVNGLEVLETLKQDVRTSHIPILLLTAKADESSRIEGLKLEADDYLTKPFNENELLLRLKNRLAIRNKLKKRYEKLSILALKDSNAHSIEDQFLKKLNHAINENLPNADFGADELAMVIGLSKSQLLRKMQSLVNMPTSVYIRNIRLEHAKIRLANRTATIAEVAYETGFSSPNYFSKCFKEYVGSTPKEYIEMAGA